jgi:hypothetical protein
MLPRQLQVLTGAEEETRRVCVWVARGRMGRQQAGIACLPACLPAGRPAGLPACLPAGFPIRAHGKREIKPLPSASGLPPASLCPRRCSGGASYSRSGSGACGRAVGSSRDSPIHRGRPPPALLLLLGHRRRRCSAKPRRLRRGCCTGWGTSTCWTACCLRRKLRRSSGISRCRRTADARPTGAVSLQPARDPELAPSSLPEQVCLHFARRQIRPPHRPSQPHASLVRCLDGSCRWIP